MDLGLTGKIAVVAGGSRGSGLAISSELAAEGARVLLTGRNADAVASATAQIRSRGGVAEGLVTDMKTEAEAQSITAAARAAFGDPDILVVNPPSPDNTNGLESISNEEYQLAHDYYVMSLVHLARAMVPSMKARLWGRIVTLTSICVKMPHLRAPMYHLNTRVAAASLTKTLSYEFGGFNITANTIAVGAIASPLAEDYMKYFGISADKMVKGHPTGRQGRVDELASVVTFLCSERASFLSGETIRVDGGASGNLF